MRPWVRPFAAGTLVVAAALTVFALGDRSDEVEPETTALATEEPAGGSTGPDSSGPAPPSSRAEGDPSSGTADDPSAVSGEPDPSATSPGPEPDPVPVPVPPRTSAPDTVGEDAAELVLPFVEASSASRADPTTPMLLQDVATGTAREDLALEAFEFAENGMVQAGTPTVVSATLDTVGNSTDPPQLVVSVCLDYSDVDIQTPDGDSVKAPDAPDRVPVILTMHEIDERWLVAERTFPDESTC